MWRCFLPQDAELAAWALGEEHRIPHCCQRSPKSSFRREEAVPKESNLCLRSCTERSRGSG